MNNAIVSKSANLYSSSKGTESGLDCLRWILLLLIIFIIEPGLAATAAVGSTPGSFRVSESGAATYTIPISVPPGTAGMAPNLSLNYNSQGGNGILGMGWSLGGLSGIYLCPATIAQDGFKGGINYDSNDRFCLDGQRLVVVSGNYGADGAEYRTETESYSRIISYGAAGSGPAWFKVLTKAGQIAEYGNTGDSRIEAQGRADVRQWGVNKVSDTTGNYLTVTYIEDNANGESYVSRIDYTGNAAVGLAPFSSVQFSYETRPDIESGYEVGSIIKTSKRMTNIQTYANAALVKDYQLAYTESPSTKRSRISTFTECSKNNDCLPATKIQWSAQGNGFSAAVATDIPSSDDPNRRNIAADYNGDGKTDFLVWQLPFNNNRYNLYLSNGNGFNPAVQTDVQSYYNAKVNNQVIGDFNADGKADLLMWHVPYNNNRFNLYLSNGNGFDTAIATQIDASGSDDPNRRSIAADVNGDGRTDFLIWHVPFNNNRYNLYLSNGNGFNPAVQTDVQSYNNAKVNNQVVGDFNADGKADLLMWHVPYNNNRFNLYLSNGSGFDPAIATNIETWDNTNVRNIAADYNGDGRTDFLVWHAPFNNYRYNLYLSNGKGFNPVVATNVESYYNDKLDNQVMGDFNSDGKADLLMWHVPYNNNRFNLYLSNGNGFDTAIATDIDTYDNTIVRNIAADYSGDGNTDFLVWHAPLKNNRFNVYYNNRFPDIIASITTGLGSSSTFTYKPATDASVYTKDANTIYPYLDYQAPIYLVSKVLANNGIGGNYETNYTYAGAKLHLAGGGLLGFRQVTATDTQTGIVTTTTYGQDYPNQGAVLSVEKRTQNGQLLNQSQNTWQNISLGAGAYHRSDLIQTIEQSWDLNGAAMPRTKTDTEYDDYGNPTKVTVATDEGYTTEPVNPYGNIKLTQNTYSNDAVNWRLGRLTRATVTSTLPSGANATRTSAFAYQPSSSLLIQEVIEPDNPSLRFVTDYTLDGFGNRITSKVSGIGIATRSSTTKYDSKGRFPTASTNALGHTETRIFDPAFGNILSMTGPNGLTSTWIYDGFGRKTQENRPDGTHSTDTYAWCDTSCPANAVYSVSSTVSGGPNSTAYFDSLNRQIRTEKVGFDGRISIQQDSQYDNQGRVASSSRPYYEGDSVAKTQYEYDILGRVTQTTEPDGGITVTEYNGLITTVTNALGQTTQHEKNGVGQLVKATDALNNSMLYDYDPFGNVTETTDPHNNKVIIDYDLRGRKIAMHDPDMGDWSYSYNVLGELVQQTNAKGQATNLVYDKLGRMIKRKEVGLLSVWKWDTAAMGKGKLASFATGNGHSRSYGYDKFGRTQSVKTTIGSSVFSITTQYDIFSRVLNTIYPTGFAVLNVYNSNGYLSEVRNAANQKPFWQATSIDAAGRVIEESLGNGLVTQRDYDLTGRTIGIRTVPFTGNAIQSLNLNYDLVGNLTNRNDDVTNRSDLFTYDELNRLTAASYSDGKLLSLDYDAIGNITRKSDVGDFSYGVKPHAVTNITGTINSMFVYDADGNQTQGLNNRTVSYTSWDMPTKITQGGTTLTYAYDANHERFRQISPSNTTIYINPRIDQGAHFEQIITPIGVTNLKESRHYIYAGSQVIGEFVIFGSSAKETRYFHSDHLGSINAVTNDTGTVLVRYDYEPFGNQTPLQGAANTIRHGFTGHEHLTDVGLIHMNGRVYDPITARFLSADPTLQFPDNLQNYNRYSYVMNNPLGFTDPSGYGLFGSIAKLWHNQYVRTALAITAATVTGQVWAPFGTFAFANTVAGGFVGGAVQSGNIKGAVHGAFSAGLFYGAGEINQGIGSLADGSFGQMIGGGINGYLQTGKPDGFLRELAAGAIPQTLGFDNAYMDKWYGNVGISLIRDGIRGGVVEGKDGIIQGIGFGQINSAFGHLVGFATSEGSRPKFKEGTFFYEGDFWKERGAITFGNVISGPTDLSLYSDNFLYKHERGHIPQSSLLGALYVPAHVLSMAGAQIFTGDEHSRANLLENYMNYEPHDRGNSAGFLDWLYGTRYK